MKVSQGFIFPFWTRIETVVKYLPKHVDKDSKYYLHVLKNKKNDKRNQTSESNSKEKNTGNQTKS